MTMAKSRWQKTGATGTNWQRAASCRLSLVSQDKQKDMAIKRAKREGSGNYKVCPVNELLSNQ